MESPAEARAYETHPWSAPSPCPACAATASQTAALGGCVSVRLLFGGSLTRLVGTRCVHDGGELAAERSHGTPVLHVSFSGASVLRARRRTVQADPASAIWNRAGECYETRHPWGPPCRGCHIAFEPELGAELDGDLPHREAGPRAVFPPLGSHLRLRRLLQALTSSRHVPSLHVEEELIAVARETLVGHNGGSSEARRIDTHQRHERVVARACELLQERYRASLRLEELARAACASPAHLTRIFRRQTGVSLHEYQTRLRLAAALEYVLESGVDLSALAHELGFASHSHLTASFRREFGCTPSQLRQGLVSQAQRGGSALDSARRPG